MPRPFHPFLLNPNAYTNSASVAPSYGTAMPAVNYNTGNSYIAYSVLRHLFGSAGLVATFPHVNNIWEDDLDRRVDRINDTHTHVLLFLQDQIRADNGFDKWNELNALIEKISVPIVVFSLGANSFIGWDTELHTKLAPGLVRFLRLLAERTISLGIRGEFTAEVLTKLGITNFQIIGCPSYFECGAGRQVCKPEWNPDGKVLATGLFSTAEHKRLHYILQSEPVVLNAWLGNAGEMKPSDEELLDTTYPGYRECMTQAIRDKRVSVYFDPARWKNFIAKAFNFAVGTRLHGSIIALNAGIPAIVTNGDMRATEVTNHFAMPFRPGICGLNFDLRQLYEELDVDTLNARYEVVFNEYCKWLRVNGLKYRPTVAERIWGRLCRSIATPRQLQD